MIVISLHLGDCLDCLWNLRRPDGRSADVMLKEGRKLILCTNTPLNRIHWKTCRARRGAVIMPVMPSSIIRQND